MSNQHSNGDQSFLWGLLLLFNILFTFFAAFAFYSEELLPVAFLVAFAAYMSAFGIGETIQQYRWNRGDDPDTMPDIQAWKYRADAKVHWYIVREILIPSKKFAIFQTSFTMFWIIFFLPIITLIGSLLADLLL